MTMVSDDRLQRPPLPDGESDEFDEAVAAVRENLDQVAAGLDTLEAQMPGEGPEPE